MIFKILFTDIWKYSKALFAFVITIIVIHLYYNYQFARLAHLVDNHRTVPHPYAFEAFPFVVYNMYSGKIDDWNKYSYLKIEADGQEVKLTDLAITREDQFVNPTQKFLLLKASNFYDASLYSYLQYSLDSSVYVQSVYNRISNNSFANNEVKWQLWIKRALEKTLKKPVNTIKITECFYTFDTEGNPILNEEKALYQF